MDKRGKRIALESMSKVERLQAENKMFRAEIKRKEMENAIKKTFRKSKGGGLKGIRQEKLYMAVKEPAAPSRSALWTYSNSSWLDKIRHFVRGDSR